MKKYYKMLLWAICLVLTISTVACGKNQSNKTKTVKKEKIDAEKKIAELENEIDDIHKNRVERKDELKKSYGIEKFDLSEVESRSGVHAARTVIALMPIEAGYELEIDYSNEIEKLILKVGVDSKNESYRLALSTNKERAILELQKVKTLMAYLRHKLAQEK